MRIKTLLLIYFSLTTVKALACECTGPYEFKTKDDLKEYSFIAFVRVDSIFVSEVEKKSEHDLFYEANVTTLETFKGESVSSILVNGGNFNLNSSMTSCDIGIQENQYWIIFAYKDNSGKQRTGLCTLSKLYSDINGEKDWKYERGIKELRLLRDIYNHPKQQIHERLNGKIETMYPSGSVEILEEFENGLRHGERVIYYPSGTKMIVENYLNGQKSGHSIWFDLKGRKERDFTFLNDHPVDTCYFYWPHNGKIRYERIFDKGGNMLKDSKFSNKGVLEEISLVDKDSNQFIKTSYFDSGSISSIGVYSSTNYSEIRTEEFFESGNKKRKWEYFPNDSTKIFKYWEWSENGDLIKNYILLNDKTKVDLLRK